MTCNYNYNDIKEAYQKLGVERGRVVLLKTDLRYLGAYAGTNRKDVLEAHFNVLSDLIDFSQGTLVVPTSSVYLLKSNEPFDIDKTRGELGALNEYIRTRPEAVRSFHPFVSYSAIGKDASFICDNVARHSFGPETPKARMVDMDTLYLSLGLEPRWTCSIVHHIEMIMGVPYRYTKEFSHPVCRDAEVREEPFYMYVWYQQCNIKKNRNIKLFEHFKQSGYKVNKCQLGKGKAYSYSMQEFYKSTVEAFRDNIYVFLDEPPSNRPYKKTF